MDTAIGALGTHVGARLDYVTQNDTWEYVKAPWTIFSVACPSRRVPYTPDGIAFRSTAGMFQMYAKVQRYVEY